MANKLLADSNRASLREIVEDNDCWGETPVSGVSRALRFTSSSIAVSKETEVSNEIRADRMVSSIIETGASSGGDINFEFSAGNTDGFFQRVLQGVWSRVMTFDVFRGDFVSIAANNEIAIAGKDRSAYFTVGRRIKIEGFADPANNRYEEVSAVAHAAGVTTVTTVGTNLVVEAGNANGSVQDANDVIVLANADIRLGTGGARTIDSNSNDAFAAAIAAKQLVAGQRIFVEGVGYETGSIAVDVGNAVADDEIVISDGVDTLTLVADTDYDIGVDADASAAAIADAINAARVAGTIYVSATASTDTVTITNLYKTGGSITGDTSLVATDFANGDATAGGFYKVITAADDVITVDRDVPTLASNASVTIKASMLRNPGDVEQITPQSVTMETSFTDVGQNFVADGLRDGGVSLEVSAGQIITGTVKREGRETKRSATAKLSNAANYTVLDAPATENVSATANVGTVQSNGIALTSAIKTINLELEGNLRKQMAVGSKFPVGISAGRLNLTGSVEAYFADGLLYDDFLNHETRSLVFPIIDQDNNTYYMTIPAFKLMSDPITPGGIDQDVMETIEFAAFRDENTNCMFQIDRFSSTDPVTA